VKNMSHFRPSNLTLKRRIEEQEVYISKKLTEYFSLILINGKSSFLPNQSVFVRVSDMRRLGGVSNDVYSFLLITRCEEYEQRTNLVLKTYGKALDPVLRTYVTDEILERCTKEFQVLRSLERVGFPAPRAYLCERDLAVLGHPFIIMQKEKQSQNTNVGIDCFAKNLAHLHNLNIAALGLDALKTPVDEYEFAKAQILYFKRFLNLSPNHGKGLKKEFEFAIRWLESNVSKNRCRKYCLLHGDYRARLNTFLTEDSKMVVIDWEEAEIGDPAYDLGIAYARAKVDFGEKTADRFVQEYLKYFDGDISERLFFYKLVGIFHLAIIHSSVLSDPLMAYEIRGRKAFLMFPFLRIPFFAKRIGTNMDIIWVELFKKFVEENFEK
jgi:aminoglycoside phosphotransferase (APT) family kinase protein